MKQISLSIFKLFSQSWSLMDTGSPLSHDILPRSQVEPATWLLRRKAVRKGLQPVLNTSQVGIQEKPPFGPGLSHRGTEPAKLARKVWVFREQFSSDTFPPGIPKSHLQTHRACAGLLSRAPDLNRAADKVSEACLPTEQSSNMFNSSSPAIV